MIQPAVSRTGVVIMIFEVVGYNSSVAPPAAAKAVLLAFDVEASQAEAARVIHGGLLFDPGQRAVVYERLREVHIVAGLGDQPRRRPMLRTRTRERGATGSSLKPTPSRCCH